MWRRTMVLAAAAAVGVGVAACGGGGGGAKDQATGAGGPPGKPIVTRSPDSGAPANAPAHWLPPEAWVYNHWLPYDENRLYRLLGITRVGLWEQLRDDRRTLAQLAARHGWADPRRLARALVAPDAARVGPARRATLEQRALRTITQGHLAQHLFFHSLHQFGIASEAPSLFGVNDMEFRRLRRAELSPLAIARLHGRSPGEVEALAIAVLRERAQTGVRGRAMPRVQADRLLRRQLSQLPRWLDQARYNGPPPTYRGALVAVPHDYATNPAISADGRHVAYEAYRQKLPLAVKLGEIAVMRADLATGRSTIISRLPEAGRTGPEAGRSGPDPISAYNAAISDDGTRIAFESSRGNQNFAKRYGRIGVLLADAGRTRGVDRRVIGVPDSQSAYNPAIAADGSRVAYQAVRDGRTVVLVADRRGRTRTVVRGARVGAERFADPYEPSLSADGTKLVYTLARGAVPDPAAARSQVLVRDVATGATVVASRAPGGRAAGGFSADPAISPDGRWVAFTSDDPALGARRGEARLFLRDLRGRTLQIPTGDAEVLDPVLARGARVVAFTARDGTRSRVLAWTRDTGAVTVVSRSKAAADGASEDPSISADGRRVAFVSSATNRDARKADDSRAIFVRDRVAGTTRMVSDPLAAYPAGVVRRPAVKPVPVAAPAARADAPLARDDVLVVDNAFVQRGERPTLTVAPGTEVTWRWRSRESHGLTVRSGPEQFSAPAKNGADYRHRFTTPGTYRLACSLHAPGMRMTVVVTP